MTYYISVNIGDSPAAQTSTSLTAVSKFTGLVYSTLVYQFCRKGRRFYQRGDIMVFATEEIDRIDRPQYKNAFK